MYMFFMYLPNALADNLDNILEWIFGKWKKIHPYTDRVVFATGGKGYTTPRKNSGEILVKFQRALWVHLQTNCEFPYQLVAGIFLMSLNH